ncbi:MAG: AI-2E family transporter [Caldilineaceae bacterium]
MFEIPLSKFLGRLVLAVGVVALAWLLWNVADILLLAFAGLLLAVFLRTLVRLVQRVVPLPNQLALTVVVFILLVVLGLGGWLLAPRLNRDLSQLVTGVPEALRNLADQFQQYPWLQNMINQLPTPSELVPPNRQFLSRFTGTLSTTFNVLTNIIFILFVALFLAGDPQMYYDGILQLVPSTRRSRLGEVLDEVIVTLRWWILGQLFSMIVIGTLTGLGLWLLGLRFALAVGVIAGLLEFIPYVGPLLTGTLAGLLAFMVGPWQALYVVLLYIGIQQFEGNLLIPIVHQYTVSLPPALTLTTFLIVWSLFGFAGLLVATPLIAVALVLVKMLYIQDVLGGTPELPRHMLRRR